MKGKKTEPFKKKKLRPSATLINAHDTLVTHKSGGRTLFFWRGKEENIPENLVSSLIQPANLPTINSCEIVCQVSNYVTGENK